MSTRRTGMPTMEFGSGRKKLTLASGGRGKVQLDGTAAFTRDGFRHFLQQACWYLDQLDQHASAGPPTPRVTKVSVRDHDPLSRPLPPAVPGVAGAPSGNW